MQESEHFRFKVLPGLILTLTQDQLKEERQSTRMAGFAKCWFLTRDAQNKHLPEFHQRVMQEPAPNTPTVASYQSMKYNQIVGRLRLDLILWVEDQLSIAPDNETDDSQSWAREQGFWSLPCLQGPRPLCTGCNIQEKFVNPTKG